MAEASKDGGPFSGPKTSSPSEPAATVEVSGDRLRFKVDLHPGETTIVSWKKLLRDAKPARPDSSLQGPESPHQLVSQPPVSSEPPSEKEQNDFQVQATSNRLSNVIERIERMYAGNGSSDEEDVVLDDVPDDDEYDTDDSFIDDAELDEYFLVDNSAIKHHGFFVNRGELDRVEPTSSTHQPTKRKQKDSTKGHIGSDDVHDPNKIVKTGNKGKKASSLNPSNPTSQSHKLAIPGAHGENMPFQAAPEPSLKMKRAGPTTKENSSGLLDGGTITKVKNVDRKKPEVLSSKIHGSGKGKESEAQDTSTHGSKGKSRDSLSNTKAALMPRKEGSSVRPKNTTLENAIRELEKTVAKSRPPSTEVQVPDNTSQPNKKRLTPEMKKKLAVVAKIAWSQHSISGKIPMDLIKRLMDIIGHLMQIKTLKRNLKVMGNMGLSAEKEKDARIEKIKQEIAEMVKQRIPHMKSKVEQEAGSADDFQEPGPDEKKALKRKYSMDDVLGNKICSLYDLYVERAEGESGPPVRRLYQELVGLWPSGFMDIEGIKRGIYRAKGRRRVCSLAKGEEDKMKKKKVVLAIDESSDVPIVEERGNEEKAKGSNKSRASNLGGKKVKKPTNMQ